MGLLSSIFSRSKPAGEAAEADSGDSVARARSRARQRLLGAVVLVGIGIIGFPLLFETQPRPIPVDVPIEIPAREGAAPLLLPSAREAQTKPPGDSATRSTAEGRKPESIITETASEAGTSTVTERVAAPAEVKEEPRERTAEVKSAERPAEKPEVKAENKPAPAKPAPPPPPTSAERAADAARARALLEGKVSPKVSAETARYIVQIGAFADPALARATRLKVERLGLVTYTHVAKTANGDRTRVRVGPVASREEAEKIAAKIKAAGLPTAILTL